MSDSETPKKKGFFAKTFGFKSKTEKEDEKRAEAAALKAEQLAKVDRQMAERMAAINAAALKSAREMDEQAEAKISNEERERIEAEERKAAEAQALKDVEAAKRLALEKEQKAKEHAEKLEAEKRETARLEAERLEKIRLEEERLEQERQETARIEAERIAAEKAALEKANAEEAATLKAKLAKEQDTRDALAAQERERAEALRLEEETRETERLETLRLAEEKIKLEQAEAKRVEDALAEQRRIETETAELKAQEEAKSLIPEPAPQTPTPAPEPVQTESEKPGFLQRMSLGLKKSTSRMSDNVSSIFNKRKLDAEALEELEDLLIASDLGVGPAMRVTQLLAKDKFDKQITGMEIKIALADVIAETLAPLEKPLILSDHKPPNLAETIGAPERSPQTFSCSTAAARNVSPAQSRTFLPCSV